MKLLFFLAIATAALCPAKESTPLTPRECAQQAFPKAVEWSECRLTPDMVLMRGIIHDFHYLTAHMYCAVRTRDGIPRLAATYAVEAKENQFVRFNQRGDEILAYHQNGTLLARMRLWETPPAAFSPAPDIVKFRLAGVEPGYVLCEAENLTRFPVLLRRGKMSLTAYRDTMVERLTLSTTVKACTLPPGKRQILRLSIKAKRQVHPTSLLKMDRVDFSYHAVNYQPVGSDITPARILPAGLPDLGEQGYTSPIRLRDDLAVESSSIPTGYHQSQLSFYQLKNGIWYHILTKNVGSSPYTPGCFECRGDHVRILDYGGNELSSVRIPHAEN